MAFQSIFERSLSMRAFSNATKIVSFSLSLSLSPFSLFKAKNFVHRDPALFGVQKKEEKIRNERKKKKLPTLSRSK